MSDYEGKLTAGFIDSADPIAVFYLDDGAVVRFRHCDDRIEVSSNVPLTLSEENCVIHHIRASNCKPLVISDIQSDFLLNIKRCKG